MTVRAYVFNIKYGGLSELTPLLNIGINSLRLGGLNIFSWLLIILRGFWLINKVTIGLNFITFNWLKICCSQPNYVSINPIVTRMLNQNAPILNISCLCQKKYESWHEETNASHVSHHYIFNRRIAASTWRNLFVIKAHLFRWQFVWKYLEVCKADWCNRLKVLRL